MYGIFFALLYALATFSCGGTGQVPRHSLPNGMPRPVNFARTDAPESQQWRRLLLDSSCANFPVDMCRGALGFEIESDGHFSAGPERGFFEGGITTAELAQLSRLADRAAQASDVSCEDAPTLLGGGALLELDGILIFEREVERECARIGARELYYFVSALAQRYYPRILRYENPACATATRALLALQDNVRSCQSDAQCQYYNDSRGLLPRSHLGVWIPTFDCAKSRPSLVAVNAALFQSRAAELERAEQAQEKVCERGVLCNSFGGFVAQRPPACRDGFCVAP